MAGKKTVKNGTWRNLEFAIAKAEEAMRKEGWTTLPGQKGLEDKGYGGLSNAITKYYGGMWAFRTLLGQDSKRPLHSLWPQLQYAIQQAQKAMEEQEWVTLPSEDVLREKGYSRLATAISVYHGGMHTFRTTLGQENLWGRWRDINYTIQQAHQAMRKEGWTTLPGEVTLGRSGYSGLAHAINDYHGGFPAFRITLGQENPMGRWKDLDYAKQQAQQAMQEQVWKTLPSELKLADKGYSPLGRAIRRHYGFRTFRKLLGQSNDKTPDGLWPQQEYAIQQAQKAMQEQVWKTLPSHGMLVKKGYSRLSSAISIYHGGFQAFRALLGQGRILTPGNFWPQEDYAIGQAKQAMKEQGWTRLPSPHALQQKGYGGLANAIVRYHGGLPAFRELLAKAQGQPTHKEHLENLLHNYLDRPDQDHNVVACRVPA